jgi:hypothetical protein
LVSRHGEVQDFGWIKPGPSPNFALLPDEVAEKVGSGVVGVLESGDAWQDRLGELLKML